MTEHPLDPERLVRAVLAAHVRAHPGTRVHGPDHWGRVERNAVWCAERSGGDVLVVRLFALFHDSQRLDDGADPHHGPRAARLAERLHGEHFALEEGRLAQLVRACERHTLGEVTDDPTVGACWDGDRLDLVRLGFRPLPCLLSTRAARELAAGGDLSVLDALPVRDW